MNHLKIYDEMLLLCVYEKLRHIFHLFRMRVFLDYNTQTLSLSVLTVHFLQPKTVIGVSSYLPVVRVCENITLFNEN